MASSSKLSQQKSLYSVWLEPTIFSVGIDIWLKIVDLFCENPSHMQYLTIFCKSCTDSISLEYRWPSGFRIPLMRRNESISRPRASNLPLLYFLEEAQLLN